MASRAFRRSTAGLLTFRPIGAWEFSRSGTLGDCTLSIGPIQGDLTGDSSEGALLLHADESPAVIDSMLGTADFNGKQELTCPDPAANQTMMLRLNELLLSLTREQLFTVSVDGTAIKGSYTEPGTSNTYDWDLIGFAINNKWTCSA